MKDNEKPQFAPAIPTVDLPTETGSPLPDIISSAGPGARFAYEEFFYARIRNRHTRKAYRHAVHKFLAACRRARLELHQISPSFVGQYFDAVPYGLATKKLHLSALRNFLDELVVRHVIVLNPALSVRTDRYQVIEGKTPELSVKQARQLLAAIDLSSVVGLRDRAVIAVLIYTAARVGAVAGLRQKDFYDVGEQYCLRFTDKGGKSREIPVRHDLRGYLLDYQAAAGLTTDEPDRPLFLSARRRTKRLTSNRLTADAVGCMLKRRLRDAGLPTRFSPHSLRVTTVTDLLLQGVPLDDVQDLVGHSDPRTTRLYDRRHRAVTRNIVERISV
jgi:site-specific recombinase XerD